MVSDGIAANFIAPRGVERTFAASFGFFALVIPLFEPLFSASHAGLTAEGGTARLIFYLAVFTLVLISAVQRRGVGAIRAVPFLLGLLLAWCLLSGYWAAAHGLSFRDAATLVVLTSSILLSADTIGPDRAFRYWRIALAGILLVSWLFIVLAYRHGGVAADWRETQIDEAGTALTALLFLFSRNGRYNWIGWLMAAAALALLILVRADLMLALTAAALLAGIAYRLAWRDGLSRIVFVAGTVLLLALAGALALAYPGMLAQALDSPVPVVGGAPQSYIALISSHPWFGVGYGMLAGDMAGQNGYLALLASLGWIGFALAMLALMVEPLARFWPLDYRDPQFRALLFALFVFFVLHNFMQSDFGESGVWFVLLLVLTALRYPDKSLTLNP
jgi:hypothetical protein